MKNTQDYKGHALWTTLQETENNESIEDLPTDTRNYLKELLIDLNKRHSLTVAHLVSMASLNNINSWLQSMSDYIPSNPSQVDAYIDQIFAELASNWPAHNGRQVADIANETHDVLVNEMIKNLDEAQGSVNKVQELTEQYESKIEEVEGRIQAFQESTETRISQIASEAQAQTEELNEELKASISAAEERANNSHNELKGEFLDKLNEVLSSANSILEEVKNTANAASGKVIADSYKTYAEQKETQTKFYDGAAIVFAVLGIMLVAFAVVQFHADETSATIFKLAVSVASFTVSGFLFRRGTFTQREAKAAKRTELALKQYKAFIANLNEDEQRRITIEIADRVFIRGEIDDNQPTMTEAIARRGLSNKDLKMVLEILRAIPSDTSSSI